VTAEKIGALLSRLDAAVGAATTPRDLEGFYRVLTAIEEETHDRP
jgi:hypothetical protein